MNPFVEDLKLDGEPHWFDSYTKNHKQKRETEKVAIKFLEAYKLENFWLIKSRIFS